MSDKLPQTKRYGIKFTGTYPIAEMAERPMGGYVAFEEASERIKQLEEALRPFAAVAEHDIGESESDADRFRPMGEHYRAPPLLVGDLRRARALLTPLNEEGKIHEAIEYLEQASSAIMTEDEYLSTGTGQMHLAEREGKRMGKE